MRCFLALLLTVLTVAGCATVAPKAPQSAAQGNTTQPAPKVVMCPKTSIVKAQNVMGMLPRVALGMDKLQVMALLGSPDHAETFALTNGNAVEVFFYHTPNTVCRVDVLDDRLLPVVFQNGRVLGYGQNYYRDFLVPVLRNPLSNIPENKRFGTETVPSAQAAIPNGANPVLNADGTPSGLVKVEDMPIHTATVPNGGDETGMKVEYHQTTKPKNQLGAGEPLK